MNQSLWEILNMAGYAMWVILAFSIIAIAVALERLVVQWRFMDRARALHDAVTRALERGSLDEARSKCERADSALADVFLVGYAKYGRTKKANLEAAVHRERVKVLSDLKSRMWMLGTIGATAPFVGLFGTVIGIMNGLGDIHETGKNDLAVVAGPISEALYATAAGILVAVEAVIIYNYFNQRLAKIALEFKMLTDEFLELLDEHGPGGGTGQGEEAEEDEEEEGDGSREAA